MDGVFQLERDDMAFDGVHGVYSGCSATASILVISSFHNGAASWDQAFCPPILFVRTKSKPSAVKRPPRALRDPFDAEVLLILYCRRKPVKSRLGSHAGAMLKATCAASHRR